MLFKEKNSQIGYLLNGERARKLTAKIKNLNRLSSSYAITRAVIFLTNKCNLKCNYCKSVTHDMPPWNDQQIFDLLGNLSKNGATHVQWTGGEASIHPRLADFVSFSRSRGMNNSISTNATLRPEVYLNLIQAGMTRFYISLDSLIVQEFDKITNSHGYFKNVLKNIKLIVQNKKSQQAPIHVTINITINNLRVYELIANKQYELKRIVNWIVESEVDDFKFLPLGGMDLKDVDPLFIKTCEKIVPKNYRMFHLRLQNIARGGHGFPDMRFRRCYQCFDDRAFDSRGAYGCVIQLREGGKLIYLHNESEQQKINRLKKFFQENRSLDPICRTYCFDLYQALNDRVSYLLRN